MSPIAKNKARIVTNIIRQLDNSKLDYSYTLTVQQLWNTRRMDNGQAKGTHLTRLSGKVCESCQGEQCMYCEIAAEICGENTKI